LLNGEQVVENKFYNVSDIAKINILILDNMEIKVINIGSGNVLSINNLVLLIKNKYKDIVIDYKRNDTEELKNLLPDNSKLLKISNNMKFYSIWKYINE
jgi:hypothetical protein